MKFTSTGWLGMVMPLALLALMLAVDAAIGPQPHFVGALSLVPMLSAAFATPRMTLVVSLITWLSAWAIGQTLVGTTELAQNIRLIIIGLAGAAAVGAAYLRQRRERALVTALRAAAAAETLREQAETDQLTGLVNRHGLLNRVEAEPVDIVRTVALVDCDGLKSVNDTLGHVAGDIYLQAIAGRLKGSLSKADLIARWGGDEFLVVQRLDLDRAMTSLSRMHRAVDVSPISIDGVMIDASVSVGVAPWAPDITLAQALITADEALYEAKRQGRNRIVTSA